MTTIVKIKIVDDDELRKQIDELYEKIDQFTAAKWALSIAKHILGLVEVDYQSIHDLVDGFKVNELWQAKKASIHDVRQAGFKIHKLAKECDSEIKKTALRVAGQAVSSGHMKEHAIIASDYAIKTIGLLYSNDSKAITLERTWQLEELKMMITD